MSRKKRFFIRLLCGFCAVLLFAGSRSMVAFADEVDEIEANIKEKQEEIDAANKKKKELLKRLLFRIPIVQIILKNSQDAPFNGYEPLKQVQSSTMHRRGQCLRKIFKTLSAYSNSNLKMRINNIIWKEVEVTSC